MIRPAPSPLAAAVAAYGLPGVETPLPLAALEQRLWHDLLDEVRRERIQGALSGAIADGTFPATPDQAREAFAEHAKSMSHVLALEARLLETVALLSAAGIESVVLKGPAVARLVYSDPSLRSFNDIDVLVRTTDFDDAVHELEGAGCRRVFPEPRPGFDRRFGKGADFVGRGQCGIDLHRTLVLGPFGLTVDLTELFEVCTPFDIAGRTLFALGPEERFLHACLHERLGDFPPRLVPLRDVAGMLLSPGLDVGRALDLATRWRMTAVLAEAVTTAVATFALPSETPLLEWSLSYKASRRDRRAMAAYTGVDRSYSRQAFAAVAAIPKQRDKIAYLWAVTFPTRSALEGYYPSRLARWRVGARRLLRRGVA